MFNDENGRKKLALSITHYAYRNTSQLENFHAGDPKQMNQTFYRTIYNVVYSKLKNVQLFQRYIDDFPKQSLDSQEDFNSLMDTVPEHLHLKFINYIKDIYFEFAYGKFWDAPEFVSPIKEGQSAAKYVLGGTFADCCKNNTLLDNTAMRNINKDVHNRIYTLLISGYFNR